MNYSKKLKLPAELIAELANAILYDLRWAGVRVSPVFDHFLVKKQLIIRQNKIRKIREEIDEETTVLEEKTRADNAAIAEWIKATSEKDEAEKEVKMAAKKRKEKMKIWRESVSKKKIQSKLTSGSKSDGCGTNCYNNNKCLLSPLCPGTSSSSDGLSRSDDHQCSSAKLPPVEFKKKDGPLGPKEKKQKKDE
ncbi:hypothetical protein niasHS_014243 [Heterodera schachtii]|uniref:FRIGIDA-like protein n=1 Tax=Heterodera schachtii TaxID=97005 RepID=A0ABD2IF48_HETSC